MYGYVSGLPDFLAYFVTGMVLLVVFATIYTLVTPQKELTLVRAGNAAATTAYQPFFVIAATSPERVRRSHRPRSNSDR